VANGTRKPLYNNGDWGILEVDTQLDCAPEMLRATRRAEEARELARLPDGWVCGRRCDVGGPMEEPVIVDFVLMHPQLGIALIDLREPIHDAEAFLRQRLEETGFGAIFTGHLPVVHGTLRRADLPSVVELVGMALAELPPLTIGGGEAWVRTLERTLVPGDRIWTDNLDGAPRGWRNDEREPFLSIPTIRFPEPEREPPHWSATVARSAQSLAVATRQALHSTVLPYLRTAAADMPERLSSAVAALRQAAGTARPWVGRAAAGASGVAVVALLAMSWGQPAPVATVATPAPLPVAAAPAQPSEALAVAQPSDLQVAEPTPEASPAALLAPAALAAAPLVAPAVARPAPRRVSFTPARQHSLAEQRQDAARARRAAAKARGAQPAPRARSAAQREGRGRG